MTAMPEKKSKFQIRREATYEALVASAMRCFYRFGYAATRVEDITDGTGHTSGAFYFHFKDKAECFWAVEEYRERLRAQWQDFLDALDPATPLDEIVSAAFGGLDRSLDGLHAWTVVVAEFFERHREDPEQRARLAAAYGKWVEELATFVKKLQAGGWVEANERPERLAVQVLAFVEGLTSHILVFGGALDERHETLVEGVVKLFSSCGLGSDGARHAHAEALAMHGARAIDQIPADTDPPAS